MSNQKRILVNAGVSVLQVIVSGIALFVLYRYLILTLGIEKLGIWSVLLASVTVARVSELGLSGSVTKFVAQHIARDEKQTAGEIVETGAISVAAAIAALSVIFYPVLKWLLAKFLPAGALSEALSVLPFALLSLWLTSLLSLLLAALDGCQRVDLRGLLLIGSNVVYLLLAFLMVPHLGLLGLAYAQIGQGLAVLFASWFILRRELPLPLLPYRWSYTLFRGMLGYGVQFQVASFSMMLYDPVTKALLSKFGGLAMVGYFEMASQMVSKLRALLVSANQVLVPVIAEMKEKSPDRVNVLYRDSYDTFTYLALPFYSAVVAGAVVISLAWLGHVEPIFVSFVVIVALGWFVNAINAPAYFAYLGTGRLRWNTISHVTIGILNLALGYFFGVLYGGAGVVIGWGAALAIGSMVITLAYRHEQDSDVGSILPKTHRALALASVVAAILGLLFSWRYYSVLSLAVLSTSVILIYSAAVFFPFWVHPLRLRLIRWGRKGLQ